jgi:hypothetical protein
MSFLRTLSATLLSAATSFTLVSASGCSTGAVGVDDCRDIQQARCRAAKACGLLSDVDACERYYKGHCLHGLATTPPSGASVASCVDVIEKAGRCAEVDPGSELSDCKESVTDSRPGLYLACDVVEHPELATECAFLTDVPPDDGAGGDGSGGSSNQGSAGAADTANGGQAAASGAPAE